MKNVMLSGALILAAAATAPAAATQANAAATAPAAAPKTIAAATPISVIASGGDPADWRAPTAPFRIAGNIFYVGSKGLAAYLIATPAGAILIDGTLADDVPMIEANISRLGFRMRDIKYLLNSHAHFDHAEGLARLKHDSGAQMLAVAAERPALESGIPPSELSYGVHKFTPVTVDRTIGDGEVLALGGTSLKAVITPGHTPGCTSWTTRVIDRGRPRDVIFLCSLTVAGNRLIGNRGYPGIVADFRTSFARLARMHADIVLPFHPEQADLMRRAARARAGARDAFFDPRQLGAIVAKARDSFSSELAQARNAR